MTTTRRSKRPRPMSFSSDLIETIVGAMRQSTSQDGQAVFNLSIGRLTINIPPDDASRKDALDALRPRP